MSTVAIIQTVWFPPLGSRERLGVARRSLESWARFTGATLRLHIADDGSDADLLDIHSAPWPRATRTVTPRLGCGGSLNAGLHYVIEHEIADLIFYGVDDWELVEDLDLTPSIALLESGAADIVRFGPTHPNLRGRVARSDIPGAEWSLLYDWDGGGYVFGWRPALYHRRLFDRFGYFAEGVAAIEAERIYNEHLFNRCPETRPRVFHAPNCTLAGPFRHIDTVELGEDNPDVLTARYALPRERTLGDGCPICGGKLRGNQFAVACENIEKCGFGGLGRG